MTIRLRLFSSVALLIVLAGCGSQSPEEQWSGALEGIKSSAATAHMVGESWSKGNVPTAYARQTLKSSEDEIKKGAEQVKALPGTRPEYAQMIEHIDRLEKAAQQMFEAEESGDRAAMSQHVKELGTEEEAINSLARSAEVEP